MGYELIFFCVALIMAICGGVSCFFSWRCINLGLAYGRSLPLALISGFIFWFFCSLFAAMGIDTLREFTVAWLGGNGFYFAVISAMASIIVQYQLLSILNNSRK